MHEDEIKEVLEGTTKRMYLPAAVLMYSGDLVKIGTARKKKEPVLDSDGQPLPPKKPESKSIRGLTPEICASIEANAAENKINQGEFITQLVKDHDALPSEIKKNIHSFASDAHISEPEFIAQLVREYEANKVAEALKNLKKRTEPVAQAPVVEPERPHHSVSLWTWILRIFGFRK